MKMDFGKRAEFDVMFESGDFGVWAAGGTVMGAWHAKKDWILNLLNTRYMMFLNGLNGPRRSGRIGRFGR